MADIHPTDSHLNGGEGERGGPAPPPGAGAGGGGGGGPPIAVTSTETVGSKRQRRPSVRLGEIGGDQLYDSHPRRSTNNKQWKHYYNHHQFLSRDHNSSNKGSKTRALTNFTTTSTDFAETLTLDDDKDVNLDTVAIGSWRVRGDSKKRASNATTKRVRSNWVSKMDDGGGGGNSNVEADDKYSGAEDLDDGYHEFDMENSESPLKENSPVHSLENLGDGNEKNEREMYYNKRTIRARDNRNHHLDGVELSGPSDTDVRDYRNNGRCGGGVGEDGVRIWLNSIGLGRYAPVFEIHEVDDEVLPMLTLEDLKDMGINAVGSRRKMFCAIQKLGKGFS